MVAAKAIVGYLKGSERVGGTGIVTDTGGKRRMGTYVVTARWKTPKSYVSDIMLQVDVRIGGVVYTGRSAGNGMAWVGRRKSTKGR